MKLIQQSKLFFKEGTSDKVYEIDLCELSPGEYLVNFRYGKRGAALKEGTKTSAAVSRANADTLFAGLENEKRKKGYQTETELFITLPVLDTVVPNSVEGTILQRLQDAVSGTNSFKTSWKTSRVIWKAGALQLKEAIPFIIKLAGKGDDMQVYAALWALVQLRASEAIPVFKTFAFNVRQKPHIRNIAKEGLLTVTEAAALTALNIQLAETLPEGVRSAIENHDAAGLLAQVNRHAGEGRVDYFTNLYLLAKIHDWLLPLLRDVIKSWAFRPPYFRQLRAVYKLAQIRKDEWTVACLSYRFEKEPAMFRRTASLDANRKQYLSVIDQSVKVGAELRSGESKLAFSHFTKKYFQKNSVDFLKQAGNSGTEKAYIKLATATLLQYEESDYSQAAERPLSDYGQYDYGAKKYLFTLFQFPECAGSLLLSGILFGNDAARKLQPNLKFITGKRMVSSTQYYYAPDKVEDIGRQATGPDGMTGANPGATGNAVINAAVNAFKNIFGRKAAEAPPPSAPPPVTNEPKAANIVHTRSEWFPEYWDAIPEAYVQLLMQARMELIHRFAYHRLKAHPRFEEIGDRFDHETLLQLLNSRFELPAQLGAEVLQLRAAAFGQEPLFIAQLLNSNSAAARAYAQALVAKNPEAFINDLDFLFLLLFNRQDECTSWINDLLQKSSFSEERLQAITGKTVTELLHLDNTAENIALAPTAIKRLTLIAAAQLERISWNIVEQLISSALEANKILAGNILIRKSATASPADIPLSLTDLFLVSELPEVRSNGIGLLNGYPDSFLAGNIRFLLQQADSIYPDVVNTMLERTRSLITGHSDLGNTVLPHLVYTLIRKEKFEGAHALISDFVAVDMRPYWNTGLKPHDIIRLLHAHYRHSQLAGYEILKAYDNTDSFSLGQIISLGNHEILAIRQWCWQYFKQHIERIRDEKGKALTLLDAKWEDTRAYAFNFFRTAFTEPDWDTDTLISITDSIRPDVEQFGKELITRYFKTEHAMEYLTKLSEHPGINVQAFVTSYLSLYAADNPAFLPDLDFYFRSVLIRVNKGRVAKDRVFSFLRQEALKSYDAATYVVSILDDIAVQSTVGDKATCIHLLTEIKSSYPQLGMHLMIKN